MELAKYIVAVVLYGTIGTLLRYVNLPSEIVAMCRGIIGAAFILIFMFATKRKPDISAIRSNIGLLIISGVSLGLNWIFLFAAYTQTTVAIASLCNYMAPIIVIIVAPFILKEKLIKSKLVWVAVALVGIVFISGVIGGESGSFTGVVLGLLAALFFVIIVICNRKLKNIDPFDRAVVQLLFSSITIFPYALIHNHGMTLNIDLRSVVIVLILGVIHTGFAYCLYFSGMAHLPVQTIAIFGYLEPVVSVLCSVFILNEDLTLIGWIGAFLILFSAVMSELKLKNAN